MTYALVAFLIFTHTAAMGIGWLVGDMRATDRVNRQWQTKDEWKRITRGWAAWMAQPKPKED